MTNLRQKADFTGKNLFIGIDVHKAKWNVSLYLEQDFLKTFQQQPSSLDLKKHLSTNYPGANYYSCYESGFSGFWIQRELANLGVNCMVINAADVPFTNKSVLNKTDSVDSKRLAQSLSNNMVKGIFVPDITLESDRILVRHRTRLVRDLQRCKIRVKSLLDFIGYRIPEAYNKAKWSSRFINWLKSLQLPASSKKSLDYLIQQAEYLRLELLKITRDIRELVKSERYSQSYKVLSSVPGVGPITAITLITEIGNINRFPHFDHFNSFIGFCPSEFSSGEKEYKGSITTRKHKRLRELFIEAAWIAIRLDPALALFYNENKNTKGGKRAIIQVARKLLNRTYNIWKRQETYEIGIIK